MDHYEALGVPRDAPVQQVRQAYLRVVLSDREGANSHRRREAAAAWAVLRDPAKRAAYDASLAGHREGREVLREPNRLPPDQGRPPVAPQDDPGPAERFVAAFPALVIAVAAVVLLVALAVSSSGALLVGLALLAVGVTSFILVPLFAAINDRRGPLPR